jgi:hypothetical protein
MTLDAAHVPAEHAEPVDRMGKADTTRAQVGGAGRVHERETVAPTVTFL